MGERVCEHVNGTKSSCIRHSLSPLCSSDGITKRGKEVLVSSESNVKLSASEAVSSWQTLD